MGGQVGGIRISRSALLLIGAMMVLAIGVSSCAKPPTVEVEAAKAAIAQRHGEGGRGVRSWRAQGRTGLSREGLRPRSQTQLGKFALFRSYKKATALVLSAQQKGQEAEQAAIRNKEQFRKDSEAAIAQAEAVDRGSQDLRGQQGSPGPEAWQGDPRGSEADRGGADGRRLDADDVR